MTHRETGRTPRHCSRTARAHHLAAWAAALLTAFAGANAFAREESGVAPTRLSLPRGPGSLGGIGENAQPTLSMGLLTYGINIEVPPGYAGLTPGLRLAYSSGMGNSIVGLGWDLATPSIERMTAKGVPLYGRDDAFAADGGDELVRVATTPTRSTYRARFEGGFIRYTWIDDAGRGAEGYWTAEYPDGSIGYFGARADGTPVDTAVVAGVHRTFRYYLTERVDVLHHHILYTYIKEGARVLPRRISYVFSGATSTSLGTPRYEVIFSYEDRPDVLSDARPGFNVRMSKRLAAVDVQARGLQLRRYVLTYEPASLSGGMSRLATLTTLGRNNEVAPIRFGFEYTASLPDGCSSGTCGARVVTIPEPIGVDARTGSVDLIDLDGDALPDVLSTRGGVHTFWFNRPEVDGSAHLSEPVISQLGHGDLASGKAELLDVNGDGFTDFLDAQTGSVLFNRGNGEWIVNDQFHVSGLPDLESPDLRYLDVNNDKSIDLVQSDGNGTRYWENRGNGLFVQTTGATSLGTGFDGGAATLADMNGDGMLDVVRVVGGVVQYRLDLGLGSFSGWLNVGSISEQYRGESKFVDMNGDGLADSVIVRAGSVMIALNRNGASFDAPRVWSSSAALPFPIGGDAVVRFADMNGSGSTDIVWMDSSGKITYLDLFAQRPNLLRRMQNGIGKIIEAEYGTSTGHLLRDGRRMTPAYRLPSVIATVDRLSMYDSLSGVRNVQTFGYHDGFYDGKEKQFRGFTRVDVATTAGPGTEPAATNLMFDVGAATVAKKGLVLQEDFRSGDRDLDTVATSYIDCVVTGSAPGVRFICPQKLVRVVKEGRPESEWLRSEETYTYDGYGNRIREVKTGVVGVSGDEQLEETSFVTPEHAGGLWLLGRPARKRTSFRPDGTGGTVEIYHYDGAPFVGLAEGDATVGLVSRTETLVDDSGAAVDTLRQRYDENGAAVESMDGNGHRRRFDYDENGLLPLTETIQLDGPGHAAYGLRMSVAYDPVQDVIVESRPWARTDRPADDSRRSLYGYDGLGRLVAIAKPGDSLAAPSEEFSYELADPVSRIVHRSRSVAGASPDLEDVQCFDGMGRVLQTRNRTQAGVYQVSGFASLGGLDKAYREALPYLGTSSACDLAAPDDGRSRSHSYDARGRVLESVRPDASIYGTPSRVRVSYAPLATTTLDEDATVVGGAHEGAGKVTRVDGLGRVVAIERQPDAGGAAAITRFGYDDHGRLASRVDPLGNVTRRVKDALGRTLRLEDPDAGTISFENDKVGKPVRRVDGRGRAVRIVYDEANRVLERFEENDREHTLQSYAYDDDVCVAGLCGRSDGELATVRYPIADGQFGIDRSVRDLRGRLVRTERVLDGKSYQLGSEFDNADRAVARLYPNGRRVELALDGVGRVVSIPGLVQSLGYSKVGTLASIVREDGFTTTYGYDALDRLAAIDTVSVTGTLQAYRYTHARSGDLVHVEDATPLGDEPSLSADYSYDGLHRLTSARLDPDRPREETLTLSYDAGDDVLSKLSSLGSASPEHMGTYVYGGGGAGPHAVTAAGGRTFAYDAAGNLSASADLTFGWDGFGRMSEVRRGAEPLARFAYDPYNTRVEKVEAGHVTYYVSPDYEVRDGAEVIYVQAGNRPLVKIESRRQTEPGTVDLGGDGRVDAADAWLVLAQRAGIVSGSVDVTGADLTRMLAASARGLLIGDPAQDQVTYQLCDQQGTIVATTDAHGRLLQRTTVYPFGGERSNQPDYREDRVFTGKELDRSSGLTYFGARYLDGRLGRWASPDPVFLQDLELCRDRPGECNLYGYAANDPIGKIDPTGTTTEDAKKALEKPLEHASFASDVFASGSGFIRNGAMQLAIKDAKWVNAWTRNQNFINNGLRVPAPVSFVKNGWAAGLARGADKAGNAAGLVMGPVMIAYGGYSMYQAGKEIGAHKLGESGYMNALSATSTTAGAVTGFFGPLLGSASLTAAAPVIGTFGASFYATRQLDEHFHWTDRASKAWFNYWNPNWSEGRRGR